RRDLCGRRCGLRRLHRQRRRQCCGARGIERHRRTTTAPSEEPSTATRLIRRDRIELRLERAVDILVLHSLLDLFSQIVRLAVCHARRARELVHLERELRVFRECGWRSLHARIETYGERLCVALAVNREAHRVLAWRRPRR